METVRIVFSLVVATRMEEIAGKAVWVWFMLFATPGSLARTFRTVGRDVRTAGPGGEEFPGAVNYVVGALSRFGKQGGGVNEVIDAP